MFLVLKMQRNTQWKRTPQPQSLVAPQKSTLSLQVAVMEKMGIVHVGVVFISALWSVSVLSFEM